MDGLKTENPIKMDDLGGPPLFLETPIHIKWFSHDFLFTIRPYPSIDQQKLGPA